MKGKDRLMKYHRLEETTGKRKVNSVWDPELDLETKDLEKTFVKFE